MSKYDKEFKIDFDSINKNIQFFDILNKIRKITYNWGRDILTSDGKSISGQEFLDTTQVAALTSADIVLVLLYNDIDVTIDIDFKSLHAPFKNEYDLQTFMQDIKDKVSLMKEI